MTIDSGAAMVKTPFNYERLDVLMEQVGVDMVLATSQHNVQYMLGGYRFFFFARMDAIGLSRYIPAVGYQLRKPETAFYVGNPMEGWQLEEQPIWVPEISNDAWSSQAVAERCAELITDRGLTEARIGLEMPFLPADAFSALARLLPHATFVNAVGILEDMRAVKRPEELALIKQASDLIVQSMLSAVHGISPNTTTQRIAEAVRQEETLRGLNFDYCLIATDRSFNRAPSSRSWRVGTSMSLDSGANMKGYIGDLARMAVIGPPTTQMKELLEEIDSVQMSARKAVRAGAPGIEIYDLAASQLVHCPHSDQLNFEAHGQGLVSHEAPHLTATGSVPYPDTHANRPLEAGMVLSIETSMRNPDVGFIKLEDTLVVTAGGYEAYGDFARGWNVVDG